MIVRISIAQQGQRHKHKHFIQDLVGESDHVPFSFGAGIPSINLRFINKEYNDSYNDGQKPLPSYPELSFPGKECLSALTNFKCKIDYIMLKRIHYVLHNKE